LSAPHSFYLAPEKWQPPFSLSGPEARHSLKSLRLKVGESIRLLDGQGRAGIFKILRARNASLELEALEIRIQPLPTGRCFLAPAYTRAARRGFLMEKAVELEAGGIWFWQAEHSQAKAPAKIKDRWREQLIAGAKQSLNPWLPELKSLTAGAEALCAEAAAFQRRFLLWEEAESSRMLHFSALTGQDDAIFVMGPEGGLSGKEVDIFTAGGFAPVSLGRRILRWETAAVFCLGLAWWARECRLAGGIEETGT
jgi:16S rRNA (uracil1498-N3)-methyltransferase